MSRLDALLTKLDAYPDNEPKRRLQMELRYARRISFVQKGRYDALLEQAFDSLAGSVVRDGALTNGTVGEIEQLLAPMQEDCKRYRILEVGHAHIDMNWMWRFDETVAITLDTFRTVLRLMEEFPAFTFAQSQASVYEIVERYEPSMLAEIRKRIQEGRWEVSASTWVEADRNLPSAESVARHFLYTKRYLPRLLGIPAQTLNLDFEPDTFGHHQNVPEMLSQAGVKYYYHCRGLEGQTLYRWRSPSGAEILSYLEPWWYLGAVTGEEAERVPEFCDRFGLDTALNVYGVGDHGGGPTRRDLERIVDMQSWPIFPRVEFGTFAQFFAAASKAKNLPLLTGEHNPVFTGCYTTQTRIKQGNAVAERMLYDSEAAASFASLAYGLEYPRSLFEQAWRKTLFNQFHDIVPGSGVRDTREYAMGSYQEVFAAAGTANRAARAAITAAIDTSDLVPYDPKGSTSEGAGVGYGVEDYRVTQVSRGGGDSRIVHFFNPLPFDREELVETTLWDYAPDPEMLICLDSRKEPAAHQVLASGYNEYWLHRWTKVLMAVHVPAMGYATYGLCIRENAEMKQRLRADPRVEDAVDMTLENDRLRAEFDPATGRLLRVCWKDGTAEECDAGFAFVEEDPTRTMTSWIVGSRMNVSTPGRRTIVKRTQTGPLYNEYEVVSGFGSGSTLRYRVGLKAGSSVLDYEVVCDWQERGSEETCIPRLEFSVREKASSYLYRTPGGMIFRKADSRELPSAGMIAGEKKALLADSRYGFCGDGTTMRVALLRSAFDPDPCPEQGESRIRLGLCVDAPKGTALWDLHEAWLHPVDGLSGYAHSGTQPLDLSYLRLESSSVRVVGVKLCEEDDGLLLRLCELEGKEETTRLVFPWEIVKAQWVDTLEKTIPGTVEINGREARLQLRPWSIRAVRLYFAK